MSKIGNKERGKNLQMQHIQVSFLIRGENLHEKLHFAIKEFTHRVDADVVICQTDEVLSDGLKQHFFDREIPEYA